VNCTTLYQLSKPGAQSIQKFNAENGHLSPTLEGTVPNHSLVMTCHWSFAICHLARQKRWAFILLRIKWELTISFSSLLVVQQGHHVVKWAEVATLSFVPCPPRPQDLMYF